MIVWLLRSLVPFNGVGSEFVGDVRGNYLSNDDIDDHMNLQLTIVYIVVQVEGMYSIYSSTGRRYV